ncbi:leukotriene B4 receptor 1-like [Epinephelus fuscoguttatus]|uniref:leukotriene B4 receptor 1-like n=1 Tax=Epinephelus fuscoguttatus TaxID=293821 RepID=UPI0020D097B2|nr:leukotriene B4 receptor 1-like [Epinephelus fuscoguttatus]
MAACLKPRAPTAPIANTNISQVLQSPVYKEEAEETEFAILTVSVHNVQLLCQQVCSMEQLNSSVVTSNISSPGHPPPASWDSSGLVSAVVLSVCFLLGVPGNIAVIILRPNWENMSSLSQILMLNLAISDLLCLITLPLWIYTLLYGWNLGLVACKLLTYLVLCSIYCSMLTVMVLSLQRYLQVVRQRSFDQVGKRKLVVLLWLVAMILSISRLVVRQLTTDQNWTHCDWSFSSEAQQVAVQLTETLIGFISISVVAFSYISLYRKVDQAAFFNNPQTTRLVTSIIVTFFVLWMPYHIINVLDVAAVLLKNEGLMKFFGDSRGIALSLTYANSCLNPLLYAFASRNMCTVCQTREH